MRVSHAERKANRQRLIDDISAGMSKRDAAAKFGYTEAYVRALLPKHAVASQRTRSETTVKREAKLREMHSMEVPLGRCAALLRISHVTASVMARRIGLKFSKSWAYPVSEEKLTKAKNMAALYRAGYTLEQIGAQYGITRERARQVMTSVLGISREDGGQHASAQRAAAAKTVKRDGRCLKKYGCTFRQWQELRDLGRAMMMAKGVGRARTPLGAYQSQERNANRRGIGWHLTLWQWWTIWQESGHWEQRGRGQGYVMCRVGDVGAYEPGNVFIALAAENSSEGKGKNNTLPVGVRKTDSGRYVAHRRINGVQLRLGTHDTPELAYAAYLMAGERFARAA